MHIECRPVDEWLLGVKDAEISRDTLFEVFCCEDCFCGNYGESAFGVEVGRSTCLAVYEELRT